MATDWEDAGLPQPSRGGYGYARNFGFVRTPMRSGATRQRRRWKDGNATMSVTFDVPTSMLYAFESFVADRQSSWFTMPLVTGDNASHVAESHSVRVVSDVNYGSIYGENIAASLQVEYYPSVAAVAPPLSIDLQSPSDGSVTAPPFYGGSVERTDYTLIYLPYGAPLQGGNWIPLEDLDVSDPPFYGGAYRSPAAEAGAVAAPAFYGGTLNLDGVNDVVGIATPAFWGGEYSTTPAESGAIDVPTFYGGALNLDGVNDVVGIATPAFWGGDYSTTPIEEATVAAPTFYGGALDLDGVDELMDVTAPPFYGGSYSLL